MEKKRVGDLSPELEKAMKTVARLYVRRDRERERRIKERGGPLSKEELRALHTPIRKILALREIRHKKMRAAAIAAKDKRTRSSPIHEEPSASN